MEAVDRADRVSRHVLRKESRVVGDVAAGESKGTVPAGGVTRALRTAVGGRETGGVKTGGESAVRGIVLMSTMGVQGRIGHGG